MAIELTEDRISLVHLQRNAERRPVVARCESYRKEVDHTDGLVRLRRAFDLDRHRCLAMLQFGEYQMLHLEPPAVAPDEVRPAMRWRVKDMLDYPVEEAAVDVLEVPGDKSATARNRSVFVACSPNSVIQRYVRLFQAAKLPLQIIDIPELAQRNVARLFEPAGRGVGFLSFDGQGSLLTISAHGELYFARRIEMTLTQLTAAHGEQRAALFERLLVELQRSLDNFERQFRSVSVAKLVVAPLPAGVAIREYLSQNIYLPVETADLGAVMDLSVVPDLKDPLHQTERLLLVGAALREFAELA